MKLYKYILSTFIVVTLLLSTSCNELDVFPQDKLGPSLFWKSELDIKMGVTGVYSRLYGGYLGWQRYWLEGITDNAYCQHGSQSVFKNIQSGILEATSGGPVAGIYSGSYIAIAACNNFMKNFNRVKSSLNLSDPEKYEAQVRFVRALAYFDLVQYYGDVPLYKNTPETLADYKVKQSPASEVYKFIYEDLDFAVDKLPNESYSDGLAVKGSALALKARIALFQSDWNKVKESTLQVINSNKYQLVDNYNSLFIKREGQVNNNEIIFSVNYLNPDYRHDAEREFYYWNALSPLKNLIDCYDSSDKRKKEWYARAGENSDTWINPEGETAITEQSTLTDWILIKHFDKNLESRYSLSAWDFRTDNNIIVLRYADVLLMYIEAMVELDGGTTTDAKAIDFMKKIRSRANLSVNITSITRDDILLERRKELAFEGLRHFDLVRRKMAKEVMNKLITPAGNCSFEDHFYVWPFPQSEVDVNTNLDQKTGY